MIGDHITGDDSKQEMSGEHTTPDSIGTFIPTHNIFILIHHDDGSNPDVEVKNPYDGIFIYRFSEGFNYPNANHYPDHLTNNILAHTRRTNANSYSTPGDRPWNDPGPRRGQTADTHENRPTLRAVILDFSSVNNVDITSVQQIIDVGNQLDRYAAPDIVNWHFACINNRWTKRALVSAGFGYPSEENELQHRWKPIFSVAEIGGSDSAASAAEANANKKVRQQRTKDAQQVSTINDAVNNDESGSSFDGKLHKVAGIVTKRPRTAFVDGINRPLFHIDLTITYKALLRTWRRGGLLMQRVALVLDNFH